MEESISSSTTTTMTSPFVYGAGNGGCCYHYHQQPPPAAAAASADSKDDADSGWTAYLLQLEDEPSASASREKKLMIRNAGAASTASKPNKDNKLLKPLEVGEGAKKKMKKLLLVDAAGHLEEDPLEDTASSPLVPPSGDLQGFWTLGQSCRV